MAVNLQSPLSKTVAEIWDEATMFNWSLNIPVIWKRAAKFSWIKRWNNGASNAEHVLLLEDLTDGRLNRKRGEFLCGARITDPVMHERFNMREDDADKSKRVAVTCKKCLEVTKRWQGENGNVKATTS